MRDLKFFSIALATLFALQFSVTSTAKALKTTKSYSATTDNAKIEKALDLMDGTTAEWAKKAILGDNVSGLPMKIKFRNLAELSPNFSDFDALGWKDGKQLYIFINLKHQNAPAEALASLLSHEAVHQDEHCSLEEETYAWGYEADVWIQMRNRNPQVAQMPCALTTRLNTLARLFKTGNFSTSNIRNVVYSNPGYKGLPVHSPGF